MKRSILIFQFALAAPAAEEAPNAFLQFVKKRAAALRAMTIRMASGARPAKANDVGTVRRAERRRRRCSTTTGPTQAGQWKPTDA